MSEPSKQDFKIGDVVRWAKVGGSIFIGKVFLTDYRNNRIVALGESGTLYKVDIDDVMGFPGAKWQLIEKDGIS